ncbi:hypothetical protein BO78DRAFT_392938 [Aspergillus sclerotiicarbonarius CBS 121057]|uniref:Uncharacterized protein n=1 Tax=Aspergillus sclerotiicarbonarius (strain CBS 121057 / IBT 28362) TaxID=1448318 RepID=A0A319EMQ3_ASPSB|nr:hypothetical protein BO78DRAFT_392938 [Aspergillus sclerotiicarbonarius CBS 121057]
MAWVVWFWDWLSTAGAHLAIRFTFNRPAKVCLSVCLVCLLAAGYLSTLVSRWVPPDSVRGH